MSHTVITILIGFIAAGLVLFGPRISEAIRTKRQADAADQAQATAFFDRMKKPPARPTIPKQTDRRAR